MKLMYRVLDFSPDVAFPSRSIWNPVIPPKIGFFAWEASLGKVLTLDQLKCRGRVLANRCFLCKEDEENIDHLLVHCKKVMMLWDLFLLIVGTSWVFPGLVIQTLFPGKELQWVKNAKTFGWQPRCVYSRLCGRRGIGWRLRMRLSQLR